jgi:NADPH:quinone reductase-like Zn-dependent oxidoreductase
VPIPHDIEPGAILTRIALCSICGTDVHLWQGSLATKIELPVILGHEMVGRIIALGCGTSPGFSWTKTENRRSHYVGAHVVRLLFLVHGGSGADALSAHPQVHV